MTKSLVKYKRNLPVKQSVPIGTIIGIIVIGLVIYLIFKNRTGSTAGQYRNKEEWDVQYNADGLPTKIIISRNATRS